MPNNENGVVIEIRKLVSHRFVGYTEENYCEIITNELNVYVMSDCEEIPSIHPDKYRNFIENISPALVGRE